MLLQLRKSECLHERPFFVWEPLPTACKTTNLQSFLEACKLVDVFSPNHIELNALFQDTPTAVFNSEALELYGQTILDSSMGPNSDGIIIIIRAAEHGALSMSQKSRPTWLPSFYGKESSKVVDPTGAGNTFLGGFVAGWQKTADVRESVCYAHVAASFALEQIGLPKVCNQSGNVACNGASVLDRLQEYRRRLGEAAILSERVL